MAAVAVALGLLVIGGAGPRRGMALAPGDPAPGIEARKLTGEKVVWRYEDHALTVVNFWATWAEPCKKEMPELQKLHDRRSKDGLAVVGVLLDLATADAAGFAKETGVTYPLLRGGNNLEARWQGIGAMPTTFLVSKQGTILRRYVGAGEELTESLVRDVEALLDGRPMAPIEAPRDAAPPS
jgi:peroxiredoxin